MKVAKSAPKRAKKKSSSPSLKGAPANSREMLLKAANKVFSDKGYDQASTREIAQLAGVNISLISYHFQGKEGLYRTCLEALSSQGQETVERVLKKPTSFEDFKTRLYIFMEEFITLHLSNPDNSCMVMREICGTTPNPVAMDLFRHKFTVIFQKFIDFLSEAQKQKYIVAGANPELIGTMIMGVLTHLMRTEVLRKTIMGVPGFLEPDQIDKTLKQVINNIINGISPR